MSNENSLFQTSFMTPKEKKNVSKLSEFNGASFTFSPGRTRSSRRKPKGVPLQKDLHLEAMERNMALPVNGSVSSSQAKEMQEEIDHLTSKVSEMALEFERQRQENNSLEGSTKRMREESERLENECRLLKKEVGLLNDKIKLLTGKCSELDTVPLKELNRIFRQQQEGIFQIKKAIDQRSTTSHICVACQERERTIVLLPCKHLCLCAVCSPAVRDRCPLCRTDIEEHMKVFN